MERNYQARTVPFQAQCAGLAMILPRTALLEKARMRVALRVRTQRRQNARQCHSVQKAIDALNGTEHQNRQLTVNVAREREERVRQGA